MIHVFFSVMKSTVFWMWILQALFEAVLVVYLPIAIMHNADPQSGTYETYWQAGCLTFTAVIIVANEKVLRKKERKTCCFLSIDSVGNAYDESSILVQCTCIYIFPWNVGIRGKYNIYFDRYRL